MFKKEIYLSIYLIKEKNLLLNENNNKFLFTPIINKKNNNEIIQKNNLYINKKNIYDRRSNSSFCFSKYRCNIK